MKKERKTREVVLNNNVLDFLATYIQNEKGPEQFKRLLFGLRSNPEMIMEEIRGETDHWVDEASRHSGHQIYYSDHEKTSEQIFLTLVEHFPITKESPSQSQETGGKNGKYEHSYR